MQPKKKILFCWSSGKDSALALAQIQHDDEYEIAALLSTITSDYDRVSMHGVKRNLLENQARALELPLEKIYLPAEADQDGAPA